MDFADLDLRTASEAGTWVQFEHDGKPLESDGKPCRVKLRGVGATAVLAGIRKISALEMAYNARISRAKDGQYEAVANAHQEKVEEASAALIVASVSGWENITWKGKPLEFTPDNVLKICGPGTYFFQQVYAEILDRHRLFRAAAND